MATSWSLVLVVALALRSAARNLDLVGRPVVRIVVFFSFSFSNFFGTPIPTESPAPAWPPRKSFEISILDLNLHRRTLCPSLNCILHSKLFSSENQ